MKRFREIPKEEKGGKKNVSTPPQKKTKNSLSLFSLYFTFQEKQSGQNEQSF
jgi:hypothetical protein